MSKIKILSFRAGLIIFLFILPSPVLLHISKTGYLEIFMVCGLLSAAIAAASGFKRRELHFHFLLLLFGSLASMLASSISQFGICVIISLAAISARLLYKSALYTALNTVTSLMFIQILCAWISVAYFFAGGEPLWDIKNPDGRSNFLFLTSFTNSEDYAFWQVIRPSGIYDEPGALSFATVLLMILNELRRPRSRIGLGLMLLGLITLSVAHVLITLFYLLYYFGNVDWLKKIIFILIALMLGYQAVKYYDETSVLGRNFISRFALEDGKLKGDNRSDQISTFFDLVQTDLDLSLRGHQAMRDSEGRGAYDGVDQSSNPFSLWFSYGFLVWTIYAATMLYLIVLGIENLKRQNVAFCALSLILLLLQRPYLANPAWCAMIWITIFSIRYASKRPNKIYNNANQLISFKN